MEKKVIVSDGIEEKEPVQIKKGKRKLGESELAASIKELYKKPFDHLERPAALSGRFIVLVIILALIFGSLAGLAGSFLILTRERLKIPFWREIDLTEFFPTREVTLVTEKKVTVTQDLRLSSLAEDSSSKIVHIYPEKIVPEEGKFPFLDQIYAPWQRISLGIIITSDGWLAASHNFVPDVKYVALDRENNIFRVEKMIFDSLSGITFLKIETAPLGQLGTTQLSVVKFADKDDLTQGAQVIIFDKFNKLHLTSVAAPCARKIYKTEDIVRSTDKYSEFLILDAETPLGAFPNGAIFDLGGTLVGLVSDEKIIPSWQFKNSIIQILKKEKIARPYLGIDYIRIEEAPGLAGALFKNLDNGAIVYGVPAPGSPAALAGIKNADIIVKVDGLSLNWQCNLTDLVQEKSPGDFIELTILREGEEKIFNIKIGEIPRSSEEGIASSAEASSQ